MVFESMSRLGIRMRRRADIAPPTPFGAQESRPVGRTVSQRPLGMAGSAASRSPTRTSDSMGRRARLALKRGFDLGFALVALAALSFLMLVLAVLLRRATGLSALVGIPTIGREGRTFQRLEFRASGDTAIERFVVASGLSRLPNVINVLRGEMACVGPLSRPVRPSPPVAALRRPAMRPGLCGPAQNAGHSPGMGDASARRAAERLDLDYMVRFSLRLDMRLLGSSIALDRQRRDPRLP